MNLETWQHPSLKTKEYLKGVTYSEIIDSLIDLNKLHYPDYFTNTKYADYPVVGISQKAACWYCA
ncbi:hypothetical protein DMA11_21075 [Marinilabiliaceae bacterium JC017]|nr:hypothetical protein DMA11_21075 [Marinilabiliaceae bacterium JC017]